MGIDIYAHWKGQTEAEKKLQYTGFSIVAGNVGYLREAYDGGPYVTKYLVAEAFEKDAKIPASIMRDRLPATVLLAMFREKKVYGKDKQPGHLEGEKAFEELSARLKDVFSDMGNDEHEEMVKQFDEESLKTAQTLIDGGMLPDYAQSFVDFVKLCESKEAETGEPVLIQASY